MSRGLQAAVALGLLLASATVASAQTPPWERDDARAEGRRVLVTLKRLMETSERGDPKPSAEALTDPSWLVRALAAIRLEVCGLDEPTAQVLKAEAAPDRPVPAADWKPLVKAREFAAALPVEVTPPVDVTLRDALRIAASLLTERIKSGPEDALGKRRLVESALAWRASVDDEADRAWLARRLLGLTDLDRALEDLSTRSPETAVGKDGKAVFDWYGANAPYLYWHPAERRFRVDVEARAAKQSTAEFRQAHPWPAGQGPLAPARETDPGR